MEKRLTKLEKKRLGIFAAAAFGLPLADGRADGNQFLQRSGCERLSQCADVLSRGGRDAGGASYQEAGGKGPGEILYRISDSDRGYDGALRGGRIPPADWHGGAGQSGAHRGKPDFLGASASGEKRESARNTVSAGEGERRKAKTGESRERPGRASAPGCGSFCFYSCISCAFS